ncbi:ComEC/Rec2 family competence protein [Halovulum marinum]|uniref:ComEC/Rec2 family competence protein n=1 Tax=Halovulum marinum TaxID=2662447 RepID=UPI0012B2B170|nr:ComEC/Rec2 family competence protein [Halovulum marinum]
MRLTRWLAAQAEAQRHTGLLWAPVALGAGIAGYFSLPAEPPAALAWGLGALALAGAGLLAAFRRGGLPMLAMLCLLGGAVAALHTGRLSAPVLERTHFGPVVGRIVGFDRSQGNRLRLLLDRVHLPGVAAADTPARVRVVLGDDPDPQVARPGARVMMRARLTPPPEPVEPGGFDFRRWAWFLRLGAIGYTAEPVVLAEPHPGGLAGVPLLSLRMRLADAIRGQMPARSGGFAAAILTGDRSTVDPQDLVGLRASNLAHLLAISGLHMGLLTGVVFACVRLGLALLPDVALRLPVKKIAAVAALLAGAGYLALSGASIATQRAFIMAAAIFGAVLVDRPALTLRAVALAALAVLLWRPVSLLGPGFQMSFAATTALIAVYDALRRVGWWQALARGGWRWGRAVAALVLTSAVAGLATAPYSAFHFNQMAQYGLLANVLAVPAMGLLVMPAALLALLLWPLGLQGLGFGLMEIGIDHILNVAGWVARQEAPMTPVPTGPPWVLGVLTLGALMLIALRGPLRAAGPVLVAVALAGWAASERPLVLLDPEGRLVGVRTVAGRALSRPRGAGFAAQVWLENDGDAADQTAAAGRAPPGAPWRVALPDGAAVLLVEDETVPPALCGAAVLLIAPRASRPPAAPACAFVGAAQLARGGAHAWRAGALAAPVTTRATEGARPWTRRPAAAAR